MPRDLVHPARCGAQLFACGLDLHGIVKPGRGRVANGQFSDGKGAFASLVDRALVNPQQPDKVGTGTLKPAQVIGMLDHTGKVGVFKIGAHGKAVHLAINQSRRGRRKRRHDPALAGARLAGQERV